MGYGFGLLAERGVDFVLQSQYTGHSAGTKFPSVVGGKLVSNYYPGLALYNWTTGALQPRSVVNQIIVAHLKPGSDIIIPSGMNHSNRCVRYFIGSSHRPGLLIFPTSLLIFAGIIYYLPRFICLLYFVCGCWLTCVVHHVAQHHLRARVFLSRRRWNEKAAAREQRLATRHSCYRLSPAWRDGVDCGQQLHE